MNILVCNVGSTSLKFKLFTMPEEISLIECKIERVKSKEDGIFTYKNKETGEEVLLEKQSILDYGRGIHLFLSYLLDLKIGVIKDIKDIDIIGFKTVLAKGYHGVHELTESVLDGMRQYLNVAPAHNKPYLEAIGQFKEVLPEALFVGVFETDFHKTIPLENRIYGVPYEWYKKYGIQKHGFHGSSHSYVSDYIKKRNNGKTGRLISCHLGGSSSICAIKDGKSIDNSLGFSPQAGLIQSSRVGDLDPFILTYLHSEGIPISEMIEDLSENGGLLGISGISGELPYIEKAAKEGSVQGKLAIAVFLYDIIRYIGSYIALLEGVDAITFTGGIGENGAFIRSMVCNKLSYLGLEIDEEKNKKNQLNSINFIK